jgi:hypothetical protein
MYISAAAAAAAGSSSPGARLAGEVVGRDARGGKRSGNEQVGARCGRCSSFSFLLFPFLFFFAFLFLKKKLIRSERHILPSDCFPSPSEMNKFSVPTDETIQLRVFFSFFSFSNRN